MSNPLERRQFARTVVRWPMTLLTSQDKTEGVTKNVSPTGVFISCRKVSISKGSVRMVIRVPGHQPINVAGKVVWSNVLRGKGNEDPPSFGMGVQFTKISDNDSHFLREVILKRYGKIDKQFINNKEP
ncbi:MAG: PilZ domain-containing protein [Deltaproteobacteria bacterium]|jgi:Tfp pilus assembly protein PilZ